jgi:hypothetical protein
MSNKRSRNKTTFPTILHNLQPYLEGVGVRWNQLVSSVSRHLAGRYCKKGNMDDAPHGRVIVGQSMIVVDFPKGGH